MPSIDVKTLSLPEIYKLMVGSVVPRPIAWVTSIDPETGRVNAAPFSCYTFCCSDPPMVAVSVGLTDGLKDTARNVRAEGSFVLNVVNEDLIGPMHYSSERFAPDVSEPEKLGIELAPSTLFRTPRVAAAPIALECRVNQILTFGNNASELFIGEVLYFHIADGLLENGRINMKRLRPLARLGGPLYAGLGEFITMPTVGTSTSA